ncbi:MAG: LysE family transporter [Bacteroidales bacterium]|nr:LysE family transporter [Bacteroidales bacterium]MDD5974199.1 LysE family transporter [Bacteroidales bacterium]MDY5193831.1 LysE family transporter [Candidatus Aphodosoma sp.]
MIDTILTGILIGICVSAPVGPLGVLCIQRTLSRGKLHGFITGMGATTSDIIYALLVSLGMSFILDFINTHQFLIQLIGSIIILLFGLHLFLKKPKNQLPDIKTPRSKGDLISDYLSAFALCFSNPLIMFLFIGLFARFQIIESGNITNNIVAFISILIGATIWWILLTLIVGYFKSKFKLRELWIINKITGSIIILLSIIGIILAF